MSQQKSNERMAASINVMYNSPPPLFPFCSVHISPPGPFEFTDEGKWAIKNRPTRIMSPISEIDISYANLFSPTRKLYCLFLLQVPRLRRVQPCEFIFCENVPQELLFYLFWVNRTSGRLASFSPHSYMH